jgi:4-amino-4-deoxy-L-arabinose transferase-like glycosyltransferase
MSSRHIQAATRALSSIPRVGLVCAVIACLNAASWSILTPPLQGPDEIDHFAYVQYLAETGRLPPKAGGKSSPQEEVAVTDLRSGYVMLNPQTITWNPNNRAISSLAQRRNLERDLSRGLGRIGGGGAGVAAPQPPLYYALQTIPYLLGSGGTLLTQLQLMRLFSALIAGLTAFFVFLFIREALPATPWAATVGGLAAAFMPLLAATSAAVNPDALFFATSAALFYTFARAFGRGLTPRLAAAIGTVIAAELLTKLNFIGLLPGVVLGMVLLFLRERRRSPNSAYRSLAIASAIAMTPAIAYLAVKLTSGGSELSPAVNALTTNISNVLQIPVQHELSYTWQLYLPRLPGMMNYFPGIDSTLQIWLRGLVGRYNWLETVFPNWVYHFALIPVGLILLLFMRGLFDCRTALRSRLAEIVVYLAISVGVMTMIGASSYTGLPDNIARFSEPRYMLPLLALGCTVLALAARGAGRRWGPVVGALIVVAVLAHDVFSQLIEIARYYG